VFFDFLYIFPFRKGGNWNLETGCTSSISYSTSHETPKIKIIQYRITILKTIVHSLKGPDIYIYLLYLPACVKFYCALILQYDIYVKSLASWTYFCFGCVYNCTLCTHQGSLRYSIIITLNFIWTFLALPVFSRGIIISLERWFASQFSHLSLHVFMDFQLLCSLVPRGALMLRSYLIQKVRISWHPSFQSVS
jgi:hypothetical protein